MRTTLSAALVYVGLTLMASAAWGDPAAPQPAATPVPASQPAATQPATLPQGPTLHVKITPLGHIPKAGINFVYGNVDTGDVVYLQRDNKKSQVFRDGVGGPEFDWILPDSVSLSPNAKHVGYSVQENEKFTPIIDGQPGPDFDAMGHNGRIFFSPDSQHNCYLAKIKGQGFRLIADSKGEGDGYEMADFPVYSPDSKHLAYVARQNDKTYVIKDGQPSEAYAAVTQVPVFSPDSQRFAYVAQQVPGSSEADRAATQPAAAAPGAAAPATQAADEDVFAIVGDKRYGPYKSINLFYFSPDSQHVAFAAMRGSKVMVIRDGVEGQPYDGIAARCPVFSPDSAHIAYWARNGGKWFVVKDTAEGPRYDSGFSVPLFSPDSKQLAYMALRDLNFFAVVNATEGPLFDSVAGLTFSPDSQHYAYGGHRGNREMIVRDGNFCPEHDGVSPPAFSPDSQHLAYCARDEENTGLVFDSQVASEKFDGSSHDGKPHFDSSLHVHILAFHNTDIFRLDVEEDDKVTR